GGGFVVLAIVDRRIRVAGHNDLRDVELRFGYVELRTIFLVEIRDVLIGDRNFRYDFAIEKLLNGQLAADVAFQIVYGEGRVFQLLLKFFLGVRAFLFGELVFHFRIGRDQIHLVGAFDQDFVVDQLIENAEFQRKRFFLRGRRRIGIYAGAIVFIDFGARDVLPIHYGPDVWSWRRFFFASRRDTAHQNACEQEDSPGNSEREGSGGGFQAAFSTLPARIQAVQTRTCLLVPCTTVLTRPKLGFQRRRRTL